MRELVLAVIAALGLLLALDGIPGDGPAPATETVQTATTAPVSRRWRWNAFYVGSFS
jgi:hypothetical protein